MRLYGRAAGLPDDILHPHAGRHTAITWLIRQGVDVAAVKQFSGHRTLAAVQAYIDEERSIQENAALRMPY